jgi:hypothetical protein
MTFSIVCTPTIPGAGEFAIAGTVRSGGWKATIYQDGRFYFYIGTGGNNVRVTTPSGATSNFVVTWDGTTNSGGFTLYRNGVFIETKASTQSPSAVSSVAPFYLGNDGLLLSATVKIRDVRLWNRVLSPSEINTLYGSIEIGPNIDYITNIDISSLPPRYAGGAGLLTVIR